MVIPPEREPINRPLNVTLSASLEKAVIEYARENKVKKSVAVRFILSSFFAGDFGKTKEISQKK